MRIAKLLLTVGVLACFLGLVFPAVAQVANAPDAQELLAKGLGALDPAAQRVRYEIRVMDGKGGETRSAFLVARARSDAGTVILADLRKTEKMAESATLASPGKRGPELLLLDRGKVTPVTLKKAQEPLGKTDLWLADLLPATKPDKAEVVGRVIFNGLRCWLVNAEYSSQPWEFRRAQVWVREDDPVVLQVEWRNKKDRPVHRVRIEQQRTADGVLVAGQVTVWNVDAGSWTVLKAQAVKADLGTPPAVLGPDLLADPKAREALWP